MAEDNTSVEQEPQTSSTSDGATNASSSDSDSFADLLKEFQDFKAGDIVDPMQSDTDAVETSTTKPEVETTVIDKDSLNIKEDGVTISTEDNATEDGGISGGTESGNKFIDELVNNPDRIKELYLANSQKQEELSRYKEQGVDEKLSAIEGLKLDDIALLKEVKNGNIDAIAKLLEKNGIDPVDLVGHDVPDDFDLTKIQKQVDNEPVVNSASILKSMAAQATVDGFDSDKVISVLGSFDERSLLDIASDPENSRKVLSSIDDVERAMNVFKEDLKYDFSGKLKDYDSFEQLKHGLAKLEREQKQGSKGNHGVSTKVEKTTTAPKENGVEKAIADINNQQKSFPNSGGNTDTRPDNRDSFEDLLSEYRSVVG